MNEHEHEQIRVGLGLIALGVEEPDGATLAHLLECPPCERELASLSEAGTTLTLIDARSAERLVRGERAEGPPAELLTRTLSAVEREQAAMRRSVHRWRRTATFSMGAAASVVALALFSGGTLSQQVEPATLRSSSVSASPWSAQGVGVLTAAGEGSEVRVQLRGLPVDEELALYAVTREGERVQQAAWAGKPDGTASMSIKSPIKPDQLDHFELTAADQLVLTLAPER